MNKRVKTIGILAHVDAGKTSLTEAMLFESGAISISGSVDKGSAITDGLKMERDRGISIKTSTADLVWKESYIHIVDTPGHIDFSSEVDRALDVLDIVILVISAVEGVQAHTMALWESIKERNIPAIFFVNKIDRAGADPEKVFIEIEKDLSTTLFALNHVKGENSDNIELKSFQESGNELSSYVLERSLENLAEIDEVFLAQYLENNISDLNSVLTTVYNVEESNALTMVLFGSAKLHLGISSLLDEINRRKNDTNPLEIAFHARVFKVSFDKKLGRLAHVRLYNGRIKTKETIPYPSQNKEIKVNQIFQLKLGKLVQSNEINTGEIGIICTSEMILAGDILGENIQKETFTSINESVLSVQVVSKEDKDYQKLGEALEVLNIEDPRLNFQWFKEEREYHLNILGPIQTEVLQANLLNRFDVESDFRKPKVIYQETPKSSAEGSVRYWMPKPCWAIMKFRIEPGERGSGWTFESKVRTSDISQKYQNEVIRSIPWALEQGIKGWKVTDLKITLLEGSDHNVHSNPGDFLLATPMGILRGLENAGIELLEPMYTYRIKAHRDFLSPVISDLNRMSASIGSPEHAGDYFYLTGRVSVEKSMDYGIQFNATTSGKGRLKLTIAGYERTEPTDAKIRPYRGVSPLDESLWILHNRGAFKATQRQR